MPFQWWNLAMLQNSYMIAIQVVEKCWESCARIEHGKIVTSLKPFGHETMHHTIPKQGSQHDFL
jgi:hypothetical protein